MPPTRNKNYTRREINGEDQHETPRSLRTKRRNTELGNGNNNKLKNNKIKKSLNMENSNCQQIENHKRKTSNSKKYANNEEEIIYYSDDTGDDSSLEADKLYQQETNINSMNDNCSSEDDDEVKSKLATIKTEKDNTFEEKLSKSVIISKILNSQQEILKKLEQLTSNNVSQSLITNGTTTAIIKMDPSQKSLISSYIRGKFKKLKFLRNDEWTQLGNKLLKDLFQILEINNDSHKTAYEKTIKSAANSVINQKRAEVMRYVKVVTMGKWNYLMFLYTFLF